MLLLLLLLAVCWTRLYRTRLTFFPCPDFTKSCSVLPSNRTFWNTFQDVFWISPQNKFLFAFHQKKSGWWNAPQDSEKFNCCKREFKKRIPEITVPARKSIVWPTSTVLHSRMMILSLCILVTRQTRCMPFLSRQALFTRVWQDLTCCTSKGKSKLVICFVAVLKKEPSFWQNYLALSNFCLVMIKAVHSFWEIWIVLYFWQIWVVLYFWQIWVVLSNCFDGYLNKKTTWRSVSQRGSDQPVM